MTRKRTLGYVENQWTCPNCGTRNRGSVQACENCGAPQPEDVKFELPSEQEFVKDEKQIQAAQAGADIHCGFCGTRNPATATTCSQCGADLKEGKARQAGQVMTAPPPPPKVIKCANCGAENPGNQSTCVQCGAALPKAQAAVSADVSQPVEGAVKPAAQKKTNWLLVSGILAFFAVVCVAGLFLFLVPSQSVQATVTDVHWQTVVPVEEIRPVNYTDERGSPPSDAYNVSCRDESREVCEQKTIDKGNGYSEVVEECHTETETYCSYTVDEWTTIQTYTLEGNDLQPVYDTPTLTSDQRLGDETVEFTVTFSTDDGIKTYSPETLSEFQQFTIGSTWTLKMNALGGIVSVEP
ncbi:MAG: zinc finger protein [Chloroflexota bacterium]|nr:zinc ribbon domain-containing protein [Chloroflexota bacterium]MBI5704822.1 zinc ribbon domain-containing protein [Chloroflexota bacterium]